MGLCARSAIIFPRNDFKGARCAAAMPSKEISPTAPWKRRLQRERKWRWWGAKLAIVCWLKGESARCCGISRTDEASVKSPEEVQRRHRDRYSSSLIETCCSRPLRRTTKLTSVPGTVLATRLRKVFPSTTGSPLKLVSHRLDCNSELAAVDFARFAQLLHDVARHV